MIERRRARGFEPLGGVGAGDLGLRPREARRLLLGHAWRVVAGESLAARLRVARVVRGTLEIDADARWAEELGPLVERLAGRLARGFPELGVERVRLRVEGRPDLSGPRAIADDPAAPASS